MGNTLELPRHNTTTQHIKHKYSQMYTYLPDEKHIHMFKAIYVNKYHINQYITSKQSSIGQIFVLHQKYELTADQLIQQSFFRNAEEKPPVVAFYSNVALDTAALTQAGFAGAYRYTADQYTNLVNNTSFQEICTGPFIVVFMGESPADLKRVDQLIPRKYDLHLLDYCNVLDYATDWKIPDDVLIELSAVHYRTHEGPAYYLVLFGEWHAKRIEIGYLEIMEALRRNTTVALPIYFYYEDEIDYASLTTHTYLPVNEPQDFKHGIMRIDDYRRKTLLDWFISTIKKKFDSLNAAGVIEPAEYFAYHMFMTYTLGFLCIRDIIYGKSAEIDVLPPMVKNIIKKARYTETTQNDMCMKMASIFDSKQEEFINDLKEAYATAPDPPQFPNVSQQVRDRLYAIHTLNYTRNVVPMIQRYTYMITEVLKKEPFDYNFYATNYYARFSFANFSITDTLLSMSIHSIPHDAIIVACMGETHRQFTYAATYLMSKPTLDPQEHAILYPSNPSNPFQVYQSDNFINLSESSDYYVKNDAKVIPNYTGQVNFKQQIFDLLITLQANIDENTMEISGGNYTTGNVSFVAICCAVAVVIFTVLVSCWSVVLGKQYNHKNSRIGVPLDTPFYEYSHDVNTVAQ